jgi:RNA polymerase sigma-70 factor (ECF subfamily)
VNAAELQTRLAAGLPYRAELKRTVRGVVRAVPQLLDQIDDVLQDAWMDAWAAAQVEKIEVRNLRGWLTTLVRRKALNALRDSRQRQMEELTEGNAPAVPVQDTIAVREALRRVMQALTPRQAAVLRDRVVKGLDVPALALVNGMNEATVRNILATAKAALRGVGLDERVLKGES